MKKVLAIVLIGLCAAAAHAADAGRAYLAPPGADPKTAPPFSNGVMVGATLYVAGHLGLDPSTGKAAVGSRDRSSGGDGCGQANSGTRRFDHG